MPAQLSRAALITLVVVGLVAATGFVVDRLLPAGDADPRQEAAAQRIVDEADRARYADREGYRFVAASATQVTPAERTAELIAAVDAVVPENTRPTTVWDRLADCESGDWDRHSRPIPGTARWDYGLTFSHGDIFEGGVNFHPQTWEAYKDPGMPGHAGRATRAEQIRVAESVLADQGWGAWPVCSRKLGLR